MPRTRRGKKGSPNKKAVGSGMTRPIESVRPVTSMRAARFGTYRSFSAARSTARLALGLTLGLAVNTLEAVARETPASLATSSRVGCDPFCGSALTPSLYTVWVALSIISRERSQLEDRARAADSGWLAG